jgi:hypothetical protein
MWTGVSPKRIATRNLYVILIQSNSLDSAALHLAVRLRRISAQKNRHIQASLMFLFLFARCFSLITKQ